MSTYEVEQKEDGASRKWDLTNAGLVALVKDVSGILDVMAKDRDAEDLDGWTLGVEHPGYIAWYHEELPVYVCATPNWDCGPGRKDYIQVEVCVADGGEHLWGYDIDNRDDVEMTAALYVDLLGPLLRMLTFTAEASCA